MFQNYYCHIRWISFSLSLSIIYFLSFLIIIFSIFCCNKIKIDNNQYLSQYDNGGRFDLRLPYADQGYIDEDSDVMGKLSGFFGGNKKKKEAAAKAAEVAAAEEAAAKKKKKGGWPW